MSIVHVVAGYFPTLGGVETFVTHLCEGLYKRGFDVEVFSFDSGLSKKREELINGVRVSRYPPLVGDPFFIPPFHFFHDVRQLESGILHVHNLQNLFPLAVSLAKKSNQHFIFHPHYHRYGQTPFRNALLTLYKLILPSLLIRRAQVIISNSEYERKILSEDFCSLENLMMIPEGLPLQELAAIKRTRKYPFRILYVGALRKYKKVEVLIRALVVLINREDFSFRLVIVGNGPDKDKLMKLASQLGVDKYIKWKDHLSRRLLLKEYSEASIFVSLSLLESFSRVVNEAVFLGIPTIVPNSAIFSKLISKGLVVPLSVINPEQLAKAIIIAKKTSVSSEGRAHLPFIEMEEYIDRIVTLYHRLLSYNSLKRSSPSV